jgi:hypothetical protein
MKLLFTMLLVFLVSCDDGKLPEGFVAYEDGCTYTNERFNYYLDKVNGFLEKRNKDSTYYYSAKAEAFLEAGRYFLSKAKTYRR